MNFGIFAKKILVIIIFFALSAISDIPYISKLLPHYFKNIFEDNTKQLKIGDIKFGITNGNIELRNIKVFNTQTNESDISADTVFFNLDLATLLAKRRLVIKNLQISGLKINYIVKDKKSNLAFLEPKTAATSDYSALQFQIRNINFFNAELNINYNNEKFKIENINFNIPELTNTTKTINLFISGAIERGKFLSALNIQQDGSINFSSEAGNINLTLFKKQFEENLGLKIYNGRTNFKISGYYNSKNNSVNFSGAVDLINTSFDRRNYNVGFKQLQLKDIAYSNIENKISINEIYSEHLYTKLFYKFTNDDNIAPDIKPDSFAAPDTTVSTTLTDIQTKITIKKIKLDNATFITNLTINNDTLLTTLDKTNLEINNLAIDTTASFSAKLNSAVNSNAALDLLMDYSDKYNYIFSLNLKNASLPNFNPYLKNYIGYIFNLGKLDIAVEHKVSNADLTAKYSLLLYNPTPKKVADIFEAPLEFALKKLRNSQGIVKLDIPITGKINDMNFKFSKVFWRIMGKTLISPFSFIGKIFEVKDTENYFFLPFNFNEAKINDNAVSVLEGVNKTIQTNGIKKFQIILNFATNREEFELPHLEVLFKRRVNQLEQYLQKNFNIQTTKIFYSEISRENIKNNNVPIIELILIAD
ncbi:MAG TPA: DUF748 domain-containing protein [bacterium]|nr:DUF748 domain-containing protein [bacterium]